MSPSAVFVHAQLCGLNGGVFFLMNFVPHFYILPLLGEVICWDNLEEGIKIVVPYQILWLCTRSLPNLRVAGKHVE